MKKQWLIVIALIVMPLFIWHFNITPSFAGDSQQNIEQENSTPEFSHTNLENLPAEKGEESGSKKWYWVAAAVGVGVLALVLGGGDGPGPPEPANGGTINVSW